MNEIKGILIAKLMGEGSRSEGYRYYIKPIDEYKDRWDEILVRKTTRLWENDPVLHDFIDKKVVIHGEIIETKSSITVDYTEIEELKE